MANKQEVVFEFRDLLFEQLTRRFGDSFVLGDVIYQLASQGLIPPKTLKEVKCQYHKMARKLHPDKGGDHNKFIELQNSYNNLVAICS